MSPSIAVGFVLQPELAYLELLEPVFGELADYFEIAPETTWWAEADGSLTTNAFADRFAALGRRWAPAHAPSRPFVAHGVGLSLGGLDPRDQPRQERWLHRLAADHQRFGFRWLSDHLAVTCLAGENLALPLPLPPTPAVAAQVRRRLAALQGIVGDVAVENTAHAFTYGDPRDELALIAGILSLPGSHLVLDLYNLHLLATNAGFDPHEFLAGLDLRRVIEIHIAGGSRAAPGWQRGDRRDLVDSHDRPVPEAVWALLATVLPACTGLRGVTLERMEGTVDQGDVAPLAEELRRLRRLIC